MEFLGLVIALGELVGDALAHGLSGGAGVAAEPFKLGDEAVLDVGSLGDLLAELPGVLVGALGGLGLGGGQEAGEYLRPGVALSVQGD